jgi:hypothetical protein
MSHKSLHDIQQSMQQYIHNAELSVDSNLFLSSQQQSVKERLAIYQFAYLARLTECMQSLFPVVAQTIGEDCFAIFVVEYVREHVPQHYSLNTLGEAFPQFLRNGGQQAENALFAPFLAELATLEYAIDEAFDCDGPEQLTPISVNALQPESLSHLSLQPVASLRLLAFEFDIPTYYTACKQNGAQTSLPVKQKSYLVIQRVNYKVQRIPLEAAEYLLLNAICQQATIAEAIATTLEQHPLTPAQLHSWFASWMRLKFFSSSKHSE